MLDKLRRLIFGKPKAEEIGNRIVTVTHLENRGGGAKAPRITTHVAVPTTRGPMSVTREPKPKD